MFKVSEVAEMLSVEKVKIFEALIVHDTLLSPYVTKERHLSYISEVGVRKLEQILFSKNFEEELEIEEEEELDIEIDNDEDDDVEADDEVEVVDHLDIFIDKCEQKKTDLRNDIIELKRKLTILDKEIKMKNDNISQYQNILSEDLKFTHDLMIKIELKTKSKEVIKQNFFSKIKR